MCYNGDPELKGYTHFGLFAPIFPKQYLDENKRPIITNIKGFEILSTDE
jgi:hypothetical protein